MMIKSMPPASAHLALSPVPAPPPMIGRPSVTLRRKASRIWVRVGGMGRCSFLKTSHRRKRYPSTRSGDFLKAKLTGKPVGAPDNESRGDRLPQTTPHGDRRGATLKLPTWGPLKGHIVVGPVGFLETETGPE